MKTLKDKIKLERLLLFPIDYSVEEIDRNSFRTGIVSMASSSDDLLYEEDDNYNGELNF